MLNKLIRRNIKKFFKDKGSLLLFVVSIAIVICFNYLFLKKLQLKSIQAIVGNKEVSKDVLILIHSWCMAGLIPIASLTSVIGVMSVIPSDRENKKTMDFRCSPIKPLVYPLSAFLTSFIISFLMGTLVLLAYSLYIYISFGCLFTIMQFLNGVCIIAITAFMGSAVLGFLLSSFSNVMIFASAGILLEALLGVASGVYVPIGAFPENARKIIGLLPFSHITSLFRQTFTGDAIAKVFQGLPGESVDQYRMFYGIDVLFNGKKMERMLTMELLLGIGVLFLLLFFINGRIRIKR